MQFYLDHPKHLFKFGFALLEWSQKECDFDKKIWYFRNDKKFLPKGDNILHHLLVA